MPKKRHRNEFFDEQAEEDSAEESDTEKKQRAAAIKKLKSSRPMSDDDDDEEDEVMDEEAVKQLKGFIAEPGEDEDDDNENDQSGSGESEDDDDVDDEDLQLIAENTNKRIKPKRVQIEGEDDDDDELPTASQYEPTSSSRVRRDEHDDHSITHHDDDGGAAEEYEDDDDFIVDDENQPLPKTSHRRNENAPNIAEAQAIFGDDFTFDNINFDDLNDDMEDEDLEDEEEEEEEEDVQPQLDEDGNPIEDETISTKRRRTIRAQRRKPKAEELFEPEELQRGYLTEADINIRRIDKPERFQLRHIPVTEAKEEELEEEAEWIYNGAFLKPTISLQPVEEDTAKNLQVKKKIKNALNYIRNDSFEVPFIAFYRKEHIEPDLKIPDLWKIWQWDEKWMIFKSHKDKLMSMFERMDKYRNYQYEQLGDTNEDTLTTRLLTDCDIDKERLMRAQTLEEIADLREQFHVYYNDDIPNMRLHEKILEYREERDKRKKLITNIEQNENDEQPLPTIDDEDELDEETLVEQIRTQLNIKSKPFTKTDYYSVCKQAHLEGLIKKFGLKPDKLGENLYENYQKNEIDQYPIGPTATCEEFICKQFPTTQAVLQAAIFMHARQLSLDPLVRYVIRRDFTSRCMINARPTRLGIQSITEDHPCYTMKYLIEKPVNTLTKDQFLYLHQSVKDGLMKIDYIIDTKNNQHIYSDEIKRSYTRDEYSDNVLEWNKIRAMCIDLMLNKFLYPKFQRELEEILLDEARQYVNKQCSVCLNDWIKIAPYRLSNDENVTSISDAGVRVLSIAYSTDPDDVSYAVILSSEGQVMDFIRLPNLMLKENYSTDNRIKKEKDFEAIRTFIKQRVPDVICIGVESRDALYLRTCLEDMVNQLQHDEEQFQNLPEPIKVLLVDTDLSKIYAQSRKGELDFRDYPIKLRLAVSQGRRLQDPLLEFSQLFNYDKEILLIKYHPLQDLIDRDQLLITLEQCFISRTNEVGVDLNRCIIYPHTSNVLQFVCGLGPRKATHLIKYFKQNNLQLENRTFLVVNYNMGKCVFSNCAGFIKINTDAMKQSESYIEILDSTRIHPEAYDWARKMAVDALDIEESSEMEPSAALEEIFQNSERLKDLDLDAFAVELKNTMYGDQSITLYDIRAELTHRYKDVRVRYEPPSQVDLFHFITKETPATFHLGKLIQCQVFDFARKKPTPQQLEAAQPEKDEITGMLKCPLCHTERFHNVKEAWNHFDSTNRCKGTPIGVRVRLDNGCTGFIKLRDLSDTPVTNPLDRVKLHQVIYARIININIKQFSVDLTSKSSELRDDKERWRPGKDSFYDQTLESEDLAEAEKEKQLKQAAKERSYVKRVIAHPSFMNINYLECERILSTKDLGDAIIRPSSKASDHLTITWKLVDGVLHNIDVIEKSKSNQFSLGKRLLIIDPRTQETEEFEDLDEILARYIKPMANTVSDIITHKYYRNLSQPLPSATPTGSTTPAQTATTTTTTTISTTTSGPPPLSNDAQRILNNLLIDDKRRNPTRIRYYITISREYPTKFLLSYMPVRKPIHEYFTVTPNGVRFRSKMFPTLTETLNWFKIHYNDNAVAPSPMRTSTTNIRVPPPPLPPQPSSSSITTTTNPMSMNSTPMAVATPMVPSGFSQPPPPMPTSGFSLPPPTVAVAAASAIPQGPPTGMVTSGFSQPPPALGTIPPVLPPPPPQMMMPPANFFAYFQQYQQQQQQQMY
ncbi:unnamed protein product [Rotaria sordida]|uniref:S1 motif domain-containing protein n=3 Tax=Rotaria sordida TaxID=392033 RepID=A0A814VFQ5_9BILA|nr:unnamed protein product [Rotaria sordida]CAF3592784.1 unnamed protein product [Rotaria sordida]CAF3653321.1 unnamed protein product [Rotaria sordida]